ncbi:hypothetical protein FQ192_32965 [Pseudomonas sp. ANT_J12]|uniref:hypothetical protein n=1 Tax=Pseudomonas sp. ANT_J12 TaxID=2597351 RepID=UPI0011F3866E|nr:hypothetical protein [Pseudomonas sp. ANT_J12]KAA0981790.1 hypothetical protein FQ192_32965 [Pseudomonas sp. ANT_J12]
MSTLNEIAANHARMAMAKAEESTGLSERHLQIMGHFEVSCVEVLPNVPAHLLTAAQDNQLGQACV